MEDGGFGRAARGVHAALNRGHGPPVRPDVIHHETTPAAKQPVFRELEEGGPSQAVLTKLRGELDRSREDVPDVERLRDQPSGHNTPARDHQQGIVGSPELWQQVVNELIHIFPRQELGRLWHCRYGHGHSKSVDGHVSAGAHVGMHFWKSGMIGPWFKSDQG
jgi:hypothetical protein